MIMYANVLLLLVRLNGKHKSIRVSFIQAATLCVGCVSNNSYWWLSSTRTQHVVIFFFFCLDRHNFDFDTEMPVTDKYSVTHCVIDNVEYKDDWQKRNRASFIIVTKCGVFPLPSLTAFATLFSIWIYLHNNFDSICLKSPPTCQDDI